MRSFDFRNTRSTRLALMAQLAARAPVKTGNVHTNTVESAFSLLKRGIVGTWLKVSAKHLAAYLDEMCFRFNNRKNPCLFRDTIVKLIQTPNLKYKELTAQQAEPTA